MLVKLMYELTMSDPPMIGLILILCAVGFALLIHAVRIILGDERARQRAGQAMDRALADKWSAGHTRAELAEMAAERWQD